MNNSTDRFDFYVDSNDYCHLIDVRGNKPLLSVKAQPLFMSLVHEGQDPASRNVVIEALLFRLFILSMSKAG